MLSTELKTYAAWGGAVLLAVATYILIWPSKAATDLESRALAEGRTIITYWDRHSGHEFEMRVDLFEEFNRIQDEIYVRAIPVGYRVEKLLTAIASGAPPDVCSLEGTGITQLATQGCFMPLDDLFGDLPQFQQDAFFPHVWDAVHFPGPDGVPHTWGIPTTTDTYCLLWNKAAFRAAGLDPERPPQTLKELEEYAAKLTIRSGDGIAQWGFLPWLPWDLTQMWGCLFGGEWYDEESGVVTCGDDPGVIASLAWQQSFTTDPSATAQLPYAVSPERILAFGKSIGEYFSANNPFYSGRVAMITEGEWQPTFIAKYAPDLDWGAAPIPLPEGVSPRSYSPTTVLDAIPAGSRHPEAAWTFLKWFHSPRPGGGPSPASDYCKAIHNIPTRMAEAQQQRFKDDPKFWVFVEQLLEKPATHFPHMPALQFLLDRCNEMREMLMLREISPRDAAMTIQRETNAELERLRKMLERLREASS